MGGGERERERERERLKSGWNTERVGGGCNEYKCKEIYLGSRIVYHFYKKNYHNYHHYNIIF